MTPLFEHPCNRLWRIHGQSPEDQGRRRRHAPESLQAERVFSRINFEQSRDRRHVVGTDAEFCVLE